MSTRKYRLKKNPFNPSVEDITSAKVVSHPFGLTMDVSKAHKRRRIAKTNGDFHFSRTWASSTTTRVPFLGRDSALLGGAAWEQYSFASATSAALGNVHLLFFGTSWVVPSVSTRWYWGRQVNGFSLTLIVPRVSAKNPKEKKGTKPSITSHDVYRQGRKN